METKKFDAEDMDAFLTLLPREVGGLPLRHALEVRHPSFQDPRFVELARRHKVAIVYADHERFPRIDEPTADFTYRSEEHTSELQSLMRISYAVFCLKKKKQH